MPACFCYQYNGGGGKNKKKRNKPTNSDTNYKTIGSISGFHSRHKAIQSFPPISKTFSVFEYPYEIKIAHSLCGGTREEKALFITKGIKSIPLS